jgi:hypothetical protein
MHATEIEVSEMQSDGSFQMGQFFAESVGEPRESANCHTHGQVAALHKTGRDVIGVRIVPFSKKSQLRRKQKAREIEGLPKFTEPSCIFVGTAPRVASRTFVSLPVLFRKSSAGI